MAPAPNLNPDSESLGKINAITDICADLDEASERVAGLVTEVLLRQRVERPKAHLT